MYSRFKVNGILIDMKFSTWFISVLVIGVGGFIFLNQPQSFVVGSTKPTRSLSVYPDPQFTPGKADTLLFTDLTKSYDGETYSQAHRNVSQSVKNRVMQEYGNPKGKVEIDHFYPICAGGSNDISNLWAEPEHVMVRGEDLGFHTKDALEAKLCILIKAGKINPKDAFKFMTTDWVKYYKQIVSPTFGAINPNVSLEDGDDGIN